MKGELDAEAGQVWTFRMKSRTVSQLTVAGGYHSPVYTPSGNAVVALHGFDLVQFPVIEPDPAVLFSLPDVAKLLGFAQNDARHLLALFSGDRVGLIDITTHQVEWLTYDANGPDKNLVDSLKQWERQYGAVSLFVKDNGSGRFRDVYLRAEGREDNLTRCEDVSCGQPSLSQDGTRVAFIRDLRKEP